jgi:hypothetical protein
LVRARLCKLQKRVTRFAAASDKVYQLLAHGRWFSPGTPQFNSFHLRLVLKGLARDKPRCPKHACPITPEIVLSFHQLLELNNAYDVTIWCLFLTAFFLMIRKSNLVPISIKTFQSQKQLIRENIEFDSKNNVLIFHMNWSKTIQYGERKLKIPVAAIPGSLLCPVRAYLNMIDLHIALHSFL